jgi:hypothetical protein
VKYSSSLKVHHLCCLLLPCSNDVTTLYPQNQASHLNSLVGKRSRLYSTTSFDTEVGGRRQPGPKPGDVFTSSKHPGQQLMCIDNCIRVCLAWKRECSVLGLTNNGKLLVATPTGVTVQGTRAQFSCFDGITPEKVDEALKAHYLWISKHLSKAPPPTTADVARGRSAQVPSSTHLRCRQHPKNQLELRPLRPTLTQAESPLDTRWCVACFTIIFFEELHWTNSLSRHSHGSNHT